MSIAKSYAFWSESIHRRYRGATTARGIHEIPAPDGFITPPEDIHRVRANWIGPSIGGYPGVIRNGRLFRPAKFETYRFLAEVDPIEVHPCPWRPWSFWQASKAAPDNVFAMDAEHAVKNPSPKASRRSITNSSENNSLKISGVAKAAPVQDALKTRVTEIFAPTLNDRLRAREMALSIEVSVRLIQHGMARRPVGPEFRRMLARDAQELDAHDFASQPSKMPHRPVARTQSLDARHPDVQNFDPE